VKVTFAGGGTGGHLYPAIAIADALLERAARNSEPMRVQFLGARDRLEAKIVPAAGYEMRFVPARALVGSGWLARVGAVAVNALGAVVAMRLLVRHKPDVLIASGGYVCFPAVLAARILRAMRLLRAPIVLLEINAQPGLTNRVLAPLVDEVWGTTDAGSPVFAGKYRATGIPIRPALRALPGRDAAAERLGLDPNKRTVLAMGGSQGARSVNDAILAVVARDALPAGWQVLHLCGERDYERVMNLRRGAPQTTAIIVRPYLADPADAYASADVVVARAGASTLGELAYAGLPAVLVPYPHAADDHQRANAQRFARAGAAVIIEDRDLSGASLGAALTSLIEPNNLERMRRAARSLAKPDAIEAIMQRIDALTGASSTGAAYGK